MAIDRFRSMEVFTRVVELGSFSGAALALQMPKGRVTTVIQELEGHLGVRLLNRTTRRVSLTDDGAMFHQHAQAMLQQVHEVEGALRQSVGVPSGRLRVDVAAAIGRHVIAPALPDFCSRYPGIVLELGSSDRPVDLLAEGYDCVVRGGDVHDESLVGRLLGRLPVLTCAAPSYLAAHGTPQTLDDLPRHRFVNFYSPRDGHLFPFDFYRDGERHQVRGEHAVACNDADTYIATGVAGLGLMQTPCSRVVARHLAEGRLVRVMEAWDAGSLPVTLLYARNRHLAAKVRAFSDWMAELFRTEFADVPAVGDASLLSPWLATLQRETRR